MYKMLVLPFLFLLFNFNSANLGYPETPMVLDKLTRAKLSHLINELAAYNERLMLIQGSLPKNGVPRSSSTQNEEEPEEEEWVVQINGGLNDALWVASLTGSELVGKMKGFDRMYVMKSKRVPSPGSALSQLNRTKRQINDKDLATLLDGLKQVSFVERQNNLLRQKRFAFGRFFRKEELKQPFNDPLFSEQWQLQESFNDQYDEIDSQAERSDHRISDVWRLGYTGKGVVVSIIDDGLDYTHGDLAPNYDPKASYDLNDGDEDPMPTMDDLNSHGTRCAGEVAMAANNSKCGVGVAYNAKIGGIRILDGKLNDRMEAEAFTFGLDHIDIMSISWGPKDDGKTAEKPGRLSQMALEKGVKEGRNGKGTIYVWASGNGGVLYDDCATDGYASSVYSFTVSAVASDGSVPWYAEKCSNTLVSTYSTGYKQHKPVVTTNPGNSCTNNHTGTSAATPIAVGIIALGLEANPLLTWRDVQHLAIWTADPGPTFSETKSEWQMNGAGLIFHPKLGFGLMNALKFVEAAKEWRGVPERKVCVTEYADFKTKTFANSSNGIIKFVTNGCKSESDEINFIEHAQLILDIDADIRGHISLVLESPEGTYSQLLSQRPMDIGSEGFQQWPFTTVQMWGENPNGVWTLHVQNANAWPTIESSIHVKSIQLNLYGTKGAPYHYMEPRKYGRWINLLEKKSTVQTEIETLRKKSHITLEEMMYNLKSS